MSGKQNRFPDLSWTLIRRLRSRDTVEARTALDELCQQYHYPLYCYIRRRGFDHHEAEDALHGFLARLLQGSALSEADEAKGHLRALITTALHRYLINWRRDSARREASLPLDGDIAEARYRKERFADDETPDLVLERKWAQELMERVLKLVELDYEANGKQTLFAALHPVIAAGGSLRGHDGESIAKSLGMKQGTLRVALSRLLKDYRTVLQAEVFRTVSRAEDVDAEIDYLRRLFHRG
jgi:RNA polymerase sigma factor (sigma-70 family)